MGLHSLHPAPSLQPRFNPPVPAANAPQVLAVQSRAKGALVVTRTVTKDARLGHTLAVNEFT